MLKPGPDLLSSEPEVALVGKLIVIENLCLATVVAIVATEMLERYLPAMRLAWTPMNGPAALIMLLAALSLHFSREKSSKPTHWLSSALAVLVALDCAASVAVQMLPGPGMNMRLAARYPGAFPPLAGISPQSAAALALLGIAVALVRMRRGTLRRIADFLAFCSALAVLVLCSGHIVALLGAFGRPAQPKTASGTLLCLLALTLAMLIRRAENGFFSVFFGRGIGSRMARLLAPLLLIAPYLHELARARLIHWRCIPPHYITAVMASSVAAISMAMMLYLAWQLNLQEAEIHALSLRDPLTGLCNLRGFRLLADQMLLVARRSGQPFSVIFLDLDNLKKVNDTLGHQAGSALLVDMAAILRDTFREADVLGRIGGDEFAVAGQLSAEAVENSAKRLQQAALEANARRGNRFPGSSRRSSREPAGEAVWGLSFSTGLATSEPGEQTPLAELLARADEEMYREKRRKKALSSPAEDAQDAGAGRPAQKARKRREPEEGPPSLFA
jgi:diguanylate cyclase (GGDEF)-like protein